VNKLLTTYIARILFSIPFLVFGVSHFAKADMMASMVPSFLPGGVLWIYLSGVLLLVGAASFISGRYMHIVGYAVAAFLLFMIVTVHLPLMSNPAMQQMAFSGFMKDAGLAGGALLLAGMKPLVAQTA
jgi:putative oxidoreductase